MVRDQEDDRMTIDRFRAAPIAAALVLCTLTPAAAAELKGTWLTEQGKATVRIADCSGALCGTIVALKEPNDPATGTPKTDKNNADPGQRSRPMIGVPVVLGMKPAGTDQWKGQVYSLEDGKTYTGSLTLQNANTLKLQGCVLGGLICKSSTWTRAG
jgi:uncharacterized protein (DUF2147 family)